MSKQEQSFGKHKMESRQAGARPTSKRALYISAALGIAALLIILWWLA